MSQFVKILVSPTFIIRFTLPIIHFIIASVNFISISFVKKSLQASLLKQEYNYFYMSNAIKFSQFSKT